MLGALIDAVLLLVAAAGSPVTAPPAAAPTAAVLPGRFLFEPPLLAPTPLSIAADRDGSLWVGSFQGLLHHDGEEVQTFDPKVQPLLRSPRAFHTVVTSDGTVWVGTGGAMWGGRREPGGRFDEGLRGAPGLYRFEGNAWRVYDERDGLPDPWVWSLVADGPAVWVGTGNGVARVRADGVTRYGVDQGLPAAPVLAIALGRGGAVLAGTPSGLYRLRDGQFVRELAGRAVVAVVEDGSGRTWAGTRAGLALLRDGREVRWLRRADGLPDDDVGSLVIDRQGRVWAGTGAGLCRMEGEVPICFGVEHGLFDPRITALAPDREGGVWVGLRSGGLQRVIASPVWNVGAPEGLPAASASAVLAARDGTVWASTPAGLVRVTGRGVVTLPRALGGEPNQARAMFEAADGSLWIATARRGVLRLAPGAPDDPVVLEDLPSQSVRSVFVDDGGDLWLGFAGGGLSHGRAARVEQGDERFGEPVRLRWEEIKAYGPADGACAGEVVMGAQGRGGQRTFAAYGGGVTVINKAGVARCLSSRDGLPGVAVVAVHEDGEGTLWIGLDHDGGLVRYRDGVFARLAESAGLACDSIYEIADDCAGNLWATCGGGVQRLSKHDIEEYVAGRASAVSPLRFGERTGLRSQETTFWAKPVSSLAPDGHLWIATSAGLSAVEAPAHLPEPPPAVIASLVIDGVPRLLEPLVSARGRTFEIEARVRGTGLPAGATSGARPSGPHRSVSATCRPAATASRCSPATATAAGARARRPSRSISEDRSGARRGSPWRARSRSCSGC
jgi:ligand-binding sensor domain-containing protein